MDSGSCIGKRKPDPYSLINMAPFGVGKDEKHHLPGAAFNRSAKFRIRSLLGHCLYRRVILWSFGIIFLVCMAITGSGVRTNRGRILGFVDFRKGHGGGSTDRGGGDADSSFKDFELQDTPSENDAVVSEAEVDDEEMPHWLKYQHIDGYFNGIKAIIPKKEHIPEMPRQPGSKPPYPLTITVSSLPTPTPFVPHPDYQSSTYRERYHEVQTCYLDEDKTVPAPDLYAYNGVVQGQADPIIGSYKLLGLRDDICFDRFGRYGPYGLGYADTGGGIGEGMDTESQGSEAVWEKTGRIRYSDINWGRAQDRCYESNKQRFVDDKDQARKRVKLRKGLHDLSHGLEKQRIERIAVVIRTYIGFQWTRLAILNFRAMISELSLRSGGEYAVHFLLHVRDDDAPIWADDESMQRLLDDNVPREFHAICTLWSEAQMKLLYPGDFGRSFENPSNQGIHGVYRSAHMPLQHFALMHPQYAHFWNWEMDMRYLGNYYELFDRMGAWGRRQSRVLMWERASKYYIPALHGSWENFTQLVDFAMEESGRRAVMGPVHFPGREAVRAEERQGGFLPASCARGSDMALCGVGEDADLITLNPLFDTDESGWVFQKDVTGYDLRFSVPPRRCAIVTASRLSRRLLNVMHEETWRHHHTMFSEMFPPSMALHHGLKAVYAPHPVYMDREWELEAVDAAFNGGKGHTTSGPGSPYDLENEHNHKGTTWYYNSEFAGLLWRRWLGYAQMDGRGRGGGRADEGILRGGQAEEERRTSSGRLCLRSMLVHPIKWEHPRERP